MFVSRSSVCLYLNVWCPYYFLHVTRKLSHITPGEPVMYSDEETAILFDSGLPDHCQLVHFLLHRKVLPLSLTWLQNLVLPLWVVDWLSFRFGSLNLYIRSLLTPYHHPTLTPLQLVPLSRSIEQDTFSLIWLCQGNTLSISYYKIKFYTFCRTKNSVTKLPSFADRDLGKRTSDIVLNQS